VSFVQRPARRLRVGDAVQVYHPGSGHADLRDVIAVRRDLGRVVVTLDTGREISWAGSTQVNVAVKGRSRRTHWALLAYGLARRRAAPLHSHTHGGR